MLVPLGRRVRHAEVDLGCLAQIHVIGLLRNLHRAVEVLGASIEVALLSEDLAELHEGTALALAVLKLARKLKVTLNEHLKFVLVHLRVNLVAAHLAQVADRYALAGNTRHLNRVPEGELVVDRGLFVISEGVVDDTQIDVGEEFTSDISDFFVSGVVVDCVLVIGRVRLSKLHVVYSDAVVSERFSMNVADGLAYLEELLVLVDSRSELSKVVIQDTSRVVSSAFVAGLAGALASEGQDIVVLEAFLRSDAVI